MLRRLQNAAAIALFACYVTGFGFEVNRASQQSHAPHDDYHSSQGQKKDGDADDKHQPTKSIGQIWRETRNDPTALFTFSVAIFTFILAASTIGLWIATILTLRHSRQTAERQLRAYVHLRNSYVVNVTENEGRSVRVAIENFGQTPANDVIFWMGTHVQEWPLRTPLERERPDIRVGVEPLAPRGHRNLNVEIGVLSPWEQGELQAGRAGIYAWGEITYNDIFGIPQRTWFQIVCEGDGLAEGLMHATEEGSGAT